MDTITVSFTMARSPENLGQDKLDAALNSLQESFGMGVSYEGNKRATFFRLEKPSSEAEVDIDKRFHRAVSDQMSAQAIDLDGVICRCTSICPL